MKYYYLFRRYLTGELDIWKDGRNGYVCYVQTVKGGKSFNSLRPIEKETITELCIALGSEWFKVKKPEGTILHIKPIARAETKEQIMIEAAFASLDPLD